jgi:hypothetical protein
MLCINTITVHLQHIPEFVSCLQFVQFMLRSFSPTRLVLYSIDFTLVLSEFVVSPSSAWLQLVSASVNDVVAKPTCALVVSNTL